MAPKYIIHKPEDITRIRAAARAAALAREQIAAAVQPGMNTKELDNIAGSIIRGLGGTPAFFGYRGFPANICISINDEVVHGIGTPDRFILKGDVVSIDVGVLLDGAVGDTAKTVYAGDLPMPADVERLIEKTYLALVAGIRAARNGAYIEHISRAVEETAKAAKLGVVRDYVGHGCGLKLHEPPEVPNFLSNTKGVLLRPGMVLAIEPMLNLGSYRVYVDNDKWTVRTADGTKSAHFEHMILITERNPEVLTSV